MKRIFQKFASVCIALVLLAGSFYLTGAPAAASTLTCSAFITDTAHRTYIDTMMQYYINANSELQQALQDGESVIFMFEGGSDNYPSYTTYSTASDNIRNQAVCIVVRRISGVDTIVFSSENCSSVPSQPSDTDGTDYNQQTTLLDGIYPVYTVNHLGAYGALQVANNDIGYYTPPSNPDGHIAGANGINIHTRANSYAQSWSYGCQLVSSGEDSSNLFNDFMKAVADIDYNVWVSYYGGSLYTIPAYKDVGYYVLDRQLALEGLENLYTETAISNLTKASREAKEAAFLNTHISESYPSYGFLSLKNGTTVRDMPCSAAVDASGVVLETATAATSYETIGVCKNDQNELWYKVNLQSSSGIGYVYAGDATAFSAGNDITISGMTLPETINQGNAYPFAGTVTANHAPLKSVDVKVSLLGASERLTGQAATDVNLLSVNFRSTKLTIGGTSQTLDDTVEFNRLEVGTYQLSLTATSVIYYVEGGTLKQTTQTASETIYFSMVDGTCTHNYQPQTPMAATCTTAGYTKYVCTTCNSSYLSDLQPLGTHSYLPATCSTPKTCQFCGVTTGDVDNNHNYGTTWLSDATLHWKACACGAIAAPAGHDYKGDICSICGYSKTTGAPVTSDTQTSATQPSTTPDTAENPTGQTPVTQPSITPSTAEPNNRTTVIVIVVASVAGVGGIGGAVGFVIIRKRKGL